MARIDISEMKVGDVRSLQEAADELGVQRATVSNHLRNGIMDYGKRGNVTLIPEDEVVRRKLTNPGSGNPSLRGCMDASGLPPVPDGYVSAQDAADILGCSRQNVYQCVDRGVLEGGRFDDNGIARMHVSLKSVMARKRGR